MLAESHDTHSQDDSAGDSRMVTPTPDGPAPPAVAGPVSSPVTLPSPLGDSAPAVQAGEARVPTVIVVPEDAPDLDSPVSCGCTPAQHFGMLSLPHDSASRYSAFRATDA